MAAALAANPAAAVALAQTTVATAVATQQAQQTGNAIMDGWNSLTGRCMQVPQSLDAYDLEKNAAEEEYATVKADAAAAETLRLRLYIYSGEHLPRERSYVQVVMCAGTEHEKKVSTPVATESEHPIWEHIIDEELQTMGHSPRVDLKVYGSRLVGDRLLSTASIRLPPTVMDSPRKQELRLSPAHTMFMPQVFAGHTPPTLHIVWQVCALNSYALDLNRVAEMDPSDMEKTSHSINLKLLKLSLNHASPQQKVGVTCRLIRLDKESKPQTRAAPLAWTWPSEKDAGKKEGQIADEALLECREASWSEGTTVGFDLEPWVLVESKVTMMNWFLDISVHSYRSSPNQNALAKNVTAGMRKLKNLLTKPDAQDVSTEIGRWREPISDLMQTISEEGHALRCDADLGIKVGLLSLELDIYDDRPHKSIMTLTGNEAIVNAANSVPIRRGMPPESKWNDRVRYMVSCYADGLPVSQDCRPYIRLTMGAASTCTDVLDHAAINDVVWKDPAMVETTRFHRKATVELYHCTDPTGVRRFESDKLLGVQTVYDVSFDKEYWVHFFGGSHNAPNADIALNMVRSTIRPGSTYQGSVALVFGSKRASRTEFVRRVTEKRTKRRLVVRLHKGLYLDRFKGQKVKILAQLAGCRLPDMHEAARLSKLQEVSTRAQQTKDPSDQDEAYKLSLVEQDPVRLNRNLLSFSGEVSEAGVLSFLHEGKRCDWVELKTVKEFPLLVPPNVSHVYLYVSAAGCEKEPPQIFARLRLNLRPPGTPNATPPRWRRFRVDRSVLDETHSSYFSNDLAGCILGSAALVLPDEDGLSSEAKFHTFEPKMRSVMLPEAVSNRWGCGPLCGGSKALTFVAAGSPGEPRDMRSAAAGSTAMRTVYCYVDILAARELPAMDEDGLMDPSYSIRVLDKKLVLPAGIHKTTSPTFMHRAVIPFEMDLEAPPMKDGLLVASSVPLPPVHVSVLDYDSASSIFDQSRFEAVGTVVVKHGPSVGSKGQWVYKMLDAAAGVEVSDLQVLESGSEWTMQEKRTLNLNQCHRASWYSLDSSGKAPFDSSAGGVDKTWHQRPRILLACGFSLTKVEDPALFGEALALQSGSSGAVWKIECPEKACYQIDIDMLGLRGLPTSFVNPKLVITSFWEGKRVEFDVASAASDHNFMQESGSNTEIATFAKKMRPLMKLKSVENMTEEDTMAQCQTGIVLYDELCGVRIRAPVYRVPVVPYLQQVVIQPGRWKMQEPATGDTVEFDLRYSISNGMLEGARIGGGGRDGRENLNEISEGRINGLSIEWRVHDLRWSGKLSSDGTRMLDLVCSSGDGAGGAARTRVYQGTWIPEAGSDPFVLLPAITFELANALTAQVYLTLTVGLNRLLLTAGGHNVRSWTELSLQEMKALPNHLKECALLGAADGESSGSPTNSPTAGNKGMSRAIKPLQNTKIMEDAYMVFVDVFAAESGYLTWEPEFQMGRPLVDQCLFYIDDDSPNLDSEVTVADTAQAQYFNPADWMFRGFEGPFDLRVTPSLYSHDSAMNSVGRTMSEAMHVKHSVISGAPTLETLRAQLKGALRRISDLLMPPQVVQRATAPLGPQQLFGGVLGPLGCVSKDDLRNMSTHQLKERLGKAGWRANSHLCAPERQKIVPAAIEESLKENLHTFMRPVGHIISPQDRDSRILARMRIGLPLSSLQDLYDRLLHALEFEVAEDAAKALVEEEKRWHKAGNATQNFLVIKFKLSGMVIWTAPEDNVFWGKPGTPLFAVQLADHPDIVVPVMVPSFDIRRKAETVWYPVKTINQRFSTLVRRIQRQTEGTNKLQQNRRWGRARSIRQQNRECPSGLEALDVLHEQPDIRVEPDELDTTEPDGYSRPIAVSKNAFVCRIRRRMGGVAFDRPQTKNWYLTSLAEVFPELKQQRFDPDNAEEYKDYVMSRFMNVRKTLTAGLERTGASLLKGHISIKRVADPDEPDMRTTRYGRELPLSAAPPSIDPTGRSVENLWISETVFIRVFVLSAHKLDLGSLGVAGSFSFKPYITASLGAEVQTGTQIEKLPPAQGNVNFYQRFVFNSTFPGTATLNLEVKHQGLMNDHVVGSVAIDIEDRLLALRRRSFREASNESYLLRTISPKQTVKMKKDLEVADPGWIDPRDPEEDAMYGVMLTPHRGLTEPSPIECCTLVRHDEETSGEGQSGLLRLWIDVTPVGAHLPEDPDIFHPIEFEVRVSVYDVDNIKVFRDFGERNDVYVKGTFRTCDYDGNGSSKTYLTDTHKYARNKACFNWNMSCTVAAPAAECTLELSLMDADKLGENDLIYFPKVYSFDHFLWLAYREQRAGRPMLGSLTEHIIFDRWPEIQNDIPTIRCGCCRRMKRRLKLNKNMFASMKVSIQIVPKEDADRLPFATGQFAEPRNRFSYVTAIENPNNTARMILGPTKWLQIRMFTGFWVVILGLLLLASLLFFIVAIVTMVHD